MMTMLMPMMTKRQQQQQQEEKKKSGKEKWKVFFRTGEGEREREREDARGAPLPFLPVYLYSKPPAQKQNNRLNCSRTCR